VVVYQARTPTEITLKLAYSKNETAPEAADDWGIQNVFKDSDPNRTNVGDYVSFRIDTAATGPDKDRIHIAAVRGSDLIYLTGRRDSSTGKYTFEDSLVVDSPGKAGKWVDLSLDKAGEPYITYLTGGGTYGGARMVLKDHDNTAFNKALRDRNNKTITGWEAMNIPTRFRVDNHRLSIENYPVRGGGGSQFWYAAVGYIGDDAFRAAYYVKY
jgi:hypothetical protein